MNECQQVYAVFVENVCKKYNCTEAVKSFRTIMHSAYLS